MGHFSISFFEVSQVERCGGARPLFCFSVAGPAVRMCVPVAQRGDVGPETLSCGRGRGGPVVSFFSGFLMDLEVVRIG